MSEELEAIYACACIGRIGNDPECPCRMIAKGLVPRGIWTAEAKQQLDDALQMIVAREAEPPAPPTPLEQLAQQAHELGPHEERQ
jgi:hypothetical protein